MGASFLVQACHLNHHHQLEEGQGDQTSPMHLPVEPQGFDWGADLKLLTLMIGVVSRHEGI